MHGNYWHIVDREDPDSKITDGLESLVCALRLSNDTRNDYP